MKMTVKVLNQAWAEWLKVAAYKGVRFGQYLSNEYSYELEGSFYEEDNKKVFGQAFLNLTQSLDDLVQ